MPSSNPLPPKENALFKRILVSNGRLKYSVLDPTLRTDGVCARHALMIKRSLRKTGKKSLAIAMGDTARVITTESPSRPLTFGRRSSPAISREHEARIRRSDPRNALTPASHVFTVRCMNIDTCRDVTSTNSIKMGSSSRSRSYQIPSSVNTGRPWR